MWMVVVMVMMIRRRRLTCCVAWQQHILMWASSAASAALAGLKKPMFSVESQAMRLATWCSWTVVSKATLLTAFSCRWLFKCSLAYPTSSSSEWSNIDRSGITLVPETLFSLESSTVASLNVARTCRHLAIMQYPSDESGGGCQFKAG